MTPPRDADPRAGQLFDGIERFDMKPKTITGHGVPKQPPGHGPNGRRFCRWCHEEVPLGRRSWCNVECMKHGTFGYSRWRAINRDKACCTLCGVFGRHLNQWPHDQEWRQRPKLEVDHIQAVRDGGSHHPDNLRTLCRPCHLKRTKEQRREKSNRLQPVTG